MLILIRKIPLASEDSGVSFLVAAQLYTLDWDVQTHSTIDDSPHSQLGSNNLACSAELLSYKQIFCEYLK